MRCPYCGSTNIIWDEERGEIVCMDCGSVIDRIYVSRDDYRVDDFKPSSPKGSVRLSRTTKEFLKLLDKVKTSKKLKGKAVIDSAKFFDYVTGRRGKVKIIKLRTPYLRNLEKDEDISIVLKLIGKFPRLNSRTDRAKIALAMLTISLVKGGNISVSEISRVTGLSRMHVRRLVRELSSQKAFMAEVRKNLIKFQQAPFPAR